MSTTNPTNDAANTRRHPIVSVFHAFVRWLGSPGTKPENADIPEGHEVDWFRIIPYISLHLMCLGVIWVGWSPIAVGIAVALYLVRMFAITGFYHRYFSHRTFQTSRFCQFLFAVAGNSAVQRGPLWWAAHHRDHHRHSDQENDIHSPHQHGFLWSHVGWITSKSNVYTRTEAVPDLAKYPELRFLDRFDVFVPVLLATALFILGCLLEAYAPSLQTTGPQMLIWGFFVSTVVLAHATFSINSLAHLIGRKRYRSKDESRNSLFLAIITLGEGWHNNHHYHPGAVRQGFYWWEIDITYYGLLLMSKLGLIWDMNRLPIKVRESNKLDQEPTPNAAAS
ncbi:MAG: acyl-CoA desaturase [Phycisphaerales bacterium]|nr:acyl-CoA desaturase [Phycisphaerales bacterium]